MSISNSHHKEAQNGHIIVVRCTRVRRDDGTKHGGNGNDKLSETGFTDGDDKNGAQTK